MTVHTLLNTPEYAGLTANVLLCKRQSEPTECTSQLPLTTTMAFRSPHRPRPPKPVQPRDDGMNRHVSGSKRSTDPQPRDPGNGRAVHSVRGSCRSNGRKPQPRDGETGDGKPKRTRMAWPRDSGKRL